MADQPVPNEFERIQSVLRMTYNRQVAKAFRDDLDENNPDHISDYTMRDVMTIKDDDSASMMLLRMLTCYMFMPATFHGGSELVPADSMYAIPKLDFDEPVGYKPQVVLTFKETTEDALEAKAMPKRVRTSFRLRERTEDITQVDIDRLTAAIRREFATPADNPYRFRTGRFKLSYRDKANGYELLLAPYSYKVGREFLGKILDIQGDEVDEEIISLGERPKKNWKKPRTKRILGETYTQPELRRVAWVKLKKAELKLHGAAKDITLFMAPFR